MTNDLIPSENGGIVLKIFINHTQNILQFTFSKCPSHIKFNLSTAKKLIKKRIDNNEYYSVKYYSTLTLLDNLILELSNDNDNTLQKLFKSLITIITANNILLNNLVPDENSYNYYQ